MTKVELDGNVILVTGSSGFIGYYLSKRLLLSGTRTTMANLFFGPVPKYIKEEL